MVAKMEHKNQRRSSWDSKMSVSSVGTGQCRNFRRSPSSILSSDSDIRFTRKKLTSQTRCGCLIIAFFLLFLLLGAVTVYIGYTYFLPAVPTDQMYRATFRVTNGETFSTDLADPSTKNFKKISKDYKERLNLLFRRSYVKHGYLGSEVLALDGTEGKDLIIHFDIKIDPSYVHITQEDLQAILANEISVGQSSLFFKNITIDPTSLNVASSDVMPSIYTTTVPTTIVTEAISHAPGVPRQCMPVQLRYCSSLGYNSTSYPNILQHRNIKDVRDHVIAFRELVDAECYRHAYEFICQILQPQCKESPYTYTKQTDLNEIASDQMILPCRSVCREFMTGCGSRISEKFKEFLDCAKFPEYTGEGSCNPKPGCVQELQSKALGSRVCDGIADCQDLSDEKTCSYCPYGQIHCGIGKTCINQSQKCDAKEDCPDGSDERGCLNLLPQIKNLTTPKNPTPHQNPYFSKGYVTFVEKGETGKLCTEHLNRSLSINRTEKVLRSVADSLCKTLTYQGVKEIHVEKDPEDDVTYVKMKDPLAQEIKFIRTKCPSKMILKVHCDELECGIQNTHNSKTTRSLSKMATHGDWPWHVALFKEDVHICDGVLLSSNWVATTTSCFQGQPKAEWTIRLGIIRLHSSSPWEQERRIIGMVKSPVEGSTVALVRLDQSVFFSDMVRPVCLPQENMLLTPSVQCNTLGWAKNKEHLQRVQVKTIGMDKCENVSISNVNSICAETIYGENDCNEEEYAGSAMVCRVPNNSNQWTLFGITNWRIACDKNGMDRPRMYDKISSNYNWIKETISSSNST